MFGSGPWPIIVWTAAGHQKPITSDKHSPSEQYDTATEYQVAQCCRQYNLEEIRSIQSSNAVMNHTPPLVSVILIQQYDNYMLKCVHTQFLT